MVCSVTILAQESFRDTLSTDYSFLYNVEVNANVKISDEFYLYQYTIGNNPENKGIIISFRIDLKESLSYSPDTTGLSFKNSYVEFSFRNMYSLIESIAVPAGFPASPGRWTGSFSKFGEAGFSGSPVIDPGNSLSGFVMQSRGLPSVREITVYPRFDVSEFFQSLNDPNLIQTIEEMDSLRNMVNYYGFTLGPWLPDSSMSLIDFSDTLETFRFRSCEELDWATDTMVCGQLENELSQVKNALTSEDSLSAANALQRFIDLVEAEKEASLTSEGYALLYFNGHYLKKRIDEED